jgi:hypothetical protein
VSEEETKRYGEKAMFSKQHVTLLTTFTTYVTWRLIALHKPFHMLRHVYIDELPAGEVTLGAPQFFAMGDAGPLLIHVIFACRRGKRAGGRCDKEKLKKKHMVST